jgi:hypothetical protein
MFIRDKCTEELYLMVYTLPTQDSKFSPYRSSKIQKNTNQQSSELRLLGKRTPQSDDHISDHKNVISPLTSS